MSVLTPQIPATPAPVGPPTPPANLTPPAAAHAPTPPPSPWRGGATPTPTPAPTTPLAPPTVPTAPPPRAATAPTTPHAAPRGSGNSSPFPFVNDIASRVTPWLRDPRGEAGRHVMGSTTVPPLIGSGLTQHIPEGLREPAEGVLNFAQRNFKDNPGLFAQVVGGLGKPLIAPILGTPAGLPMMAGLYGALTGGESGRAAHDFFRPVIDRFRSSATPSPG